MRIAVVFGIFVGLATSAIANVDNEILPSIDGMQGLSIKVKSNEQRDLLLRYEGEFGFDFASVRRDGSSETFVTADKVEDFKKTLKDHGIEFQVIVKDLKPILTRGFSSKRRSARILRGLGSFFSQRNDFPDYDNDIKRYLKDLSDKHGDLVSLFSIGKSYEGRDTYAVKISTGGPVAKPIVLIDAGIHAREWIAPSTALYIIDQLSRNSTNRYIIENVDFYIVPSINPDGYQFTHKSPNNRMWRKTRSKNPGTTCRGADANRNFDLAWNLVGASNNPCTEIYAGKSAFSEVEARNFRDLVLNINTQRQVKVYLTLHSYGQMMLHPWGFTSDLPQNEPTLRCVAQQAESALSKVRGTHYTIGSSTNVLYAAAGGSDDWTMAIGGADLAYTVELPGGVGGFAPSPTEIIPVGVETFEAVKVFADFAEGKVNCP